MKLKFNLKLAKILKKSGLVSEEIESNFGFYNDEREIIIDHKDLNEDFLVGLEKWAKANPKEEYANGIMQSMSMIKSIEKDVGGKFPKRLDALEEAIKLWIAKDHINFYLYRVNDTGFSEPYLVTNVRYHPKTDKDVPAMVCVNMKYINQNREHTYTLSFYYDDLQMVDTVKELFSKNRFYHEDENMTKKYQSQIVKYKEMCTKFGVQYLAEGYGKGDHSVGISMTRDGKKAKVVQDFEMKDGLQSVYSNITFWNFAKKEKNDDKSTIVPVHTWIKVFDLHVHKNFWCHVDNLTEYVYNPELINLLILPEEIKEIVGILSESVGENIEDIIKGKSEGIFMLLKGPPGTGKTLTAEVYSEVIKKPLYSVQSAQLGVDPLKLEENLKNILGRAQAWGAILHIDEVDVYMRERGDDLMQNAIVGVWLRTIEYYRGMLIATTNKDTAIDDAIKSRANAIIQYPVPDENNARRIWNNLVDENSMKFSKGTIDYCITRFPKITGRSMKNIVSLSKKLMKRKDVNEITQEIVDLAAIYTYINGETKKLLTNKIK